MNTGTSNYTKMRHLVVICIGYIDKALSLYSSWSLTQGGCENTNVALSQNQIE